MTTYEVAGVKVSTPDDLFDLPSGVLVQKYNELTGKKTTKFSSKANGVRQVWAALHDVAQMEKIDAEIEALEAEAESKPLPERKPRKLRNKTGRRTRFNVAARGHIVEHRAEQHSKRAKMIQVLRGSGATLEEVQELCHWDTRTAKDGIRLLHTKLGYGLREGEDGIIHLLVR